MKYTWEHRLRRIDELSKDLAYSREILRFLAEILIWQRASHARLAAPDRRLTGSLEIDHHFVLESFGSLLDLVSRCGSESLAAEAEALKDAPDTWKSMLFLYWNGNLPWERSFFIRACLQPYLEALVESSTAPFDSDLNAASVNAGESERLRRCPFCGRKPQLALLTGDASPTRVADGSTEGSRRFLMCGDCLTVWAYQRIACINCDESIPGRLPYYVAENAPHMRVDCCDSCKRYLKTIDLTVDRRPVPIVDELAAIPLDLWARDQGYTKVQPNLAGM